MRAETAVSVTITLGFFLLVAAMVTTPPDAFSVLAIVLLLEHASMLGIRRS